MDSFLLGGWQGLFCVGRSLGEGICLSLVGKVCVGQSGVRFPLFYLCQAVVCLIVC